MWFKKRIALGVPGTSRCSAISVCSGQLCISVVFSPALERAMAAAGLSHSHESARSGYASAQVSDSGFDTGLPIDPGSPAFGEV
jgi:hypothetical protein